jgi:hypothetical protein
MSTVAASRSTSDQPIARHSPIRHPVANIIRVRSGRQVPGLCFLARFHDIEPGLPLVSRQGAGSAPRWTVDPTDLTDGIDGYGTLPRGVAHCSRYDDLRGTGATRRPLLDRVEGAVDDRRRHLSDPTVTRIWRKWNLPVQALDRTAPILPIMPGVPEKQTHDDVRNGTTTLSAALEVATAGSSTPACCGVAIRNSCGSSSGSPWPTRG